MSIITETTTEARYADGKIQVLIGSVVELSFPVSNNPRLAKGTPEELNNIEISPFGLHWPDLDEDLSFEGLRSGDCGQNN